MVVYPSRPQNAVLSLRLVGTNIQEGSFSYSELFKALITALEQTHQAIDTLIKLASLTYDTIATRAGVATAAADEASKI